MFIFNASPASPRYTQSLAPVPFRCLSASYARMTTSRDTDTLPRRVSNETRPKARVLLLTGLWEVDQADDLGDIYILLPD